MAEVWDATLEEVKAASDTRETARNNAQIARAIASSTESIERDLLRRRFYPEVATRSFDFPVHVDPVTGARVLWLGRHELVAYTELRVEDVAVDAEHITLLPADEDADGPPYGAVELDSTVALSGENGKRAVEIDGTFGFWDAEDPAGALAASVDDTSTTSVTVSDSAAVGVGHLLTIGAERMIVTDKAMIDSGQNTAGALTASANAEQLPVGSGSAFVKGEVVLVDAEKMLVVEIAGNTLIVKRDWDGSTLAAHNSAADVYVARRLTVRRGVLGTTAATHSNGAAITRHRIPGLVNQLCIAEAMTSVAQENTLYGRRVGSGDSERDAAGAGIEDLRRRAWEAYGRQAY